MSTEREQLKHEIAKLNLEQMALKTLLNSGYGAFLNKHFRYSNPDMGEAITLTGQLVSRRCADAANEWSENLTGDPTPVVIYQDTDSAYLTLNPILQKFGISDLDTIDKISSEKVAPFLNATAKTVLEDLNAFVSDRMNFKRETISSSGFWTAKKRYALAVVDDEGIRPTEPKIKTTGLEVVRSSTPKVVRDMLKEAIKMILTSDEETVQHYIAVQEEIFKSLPPEEVASPRGLNDINQYADPSAIYQKGKGVTTPIHTRGALLYNHWIKKLNLDKDEVMLYSGDKLKFVYLKMPNPIHENVIAFPRTLPAGLNLHNFIDYDTQFEKTFLAPIRKIMEIVGWEIEKTQTLEDLFA